MAEKEGLKEFDLNKISKPGKFLKFVAGKPVLVRILTKDPVVQQKEFSNDGEINLSMKLCFVVWNFTDECAQIMSVTPNMAKRLQNIAKDEDFGADLQKCDIKISPEGEKLSRVYDINVVKHSDNAKKLANEMIKEAAKIDLLKDIEDNKGRLSEFEPEKATTSQEPDPTPPEDEIDSDEPINLDDIPF